MVAIESLERDISAARRMVDRKVGSALALAKEGKELQVSVTELKQNISYYEKAASILASISDERQSLAQQQIESLVTQGLQTIFGEEISFHIVSKLQGRNTVVDFIVRSTLSDGTIVETPVLDARGGGLAALVGFFLRLIMILLSPDNVRPILFLDESFSHLSAEYEPRLAEFIRDLVDKTGMQIVLVTHSDAYSDSADRKYRFSMKNGVTQISEV